MRVHQEETNGSVSRGASLASSWLNLYVAALVLVLGLAFAFVVPAGAGLDEPMHVARTEQLAEGMLLPQRIESEGLEVSLVAPTSGRYQAYGGQTDAALYELVARGTQSYYGEDADSSRGYSFPTWTDERLLVEGEMGEGTVTWIFSNTSINSLVSYLPHVIGYGVGTLLSSSPVFVLLSMRVAGVVTLALTVWACMSLLPVGRRLFAFVALLPSTVAVNSMVTADLMTFACVSLYVSCLVRMIWLDRAGRLEWGVLWASLFGLCLAKVAYAPFGLLLFLLPALSPTWRSPRCLVRLGVIGVTSLAGFLVWYLIVHDVNTGLMWSSKIDPDAQLSFVLSNPLTFLGVVVQGLLGADLLVMSSWTAFTHLVGATWPTALTLAVAMATECLGLRDRRLGLRRALTFSLVVLAVASLACLLIYLALYLQFNPPGATMVDGIQTRYFLPLVFPTLFSVLVLCAGCPPTGGAGRDGVAALEGEGGGDADVALPRPARGSDVPLAVFLTLLSLLTFVSICLTIY